MAAVVGGGLKAFGIEIPALASGRRQITLGVLGLILAGGSIALARPRATLDERAVLTRGTWTLMKAVDDSGADWSNSTLKFTSQKKVRDGYQLAGFFEWRLANQLVGREEFQGHYLPSQAEIILEGTKVALSDSTRGALLSPGSYSAKLSPDGRALTDGTWATVTGQQYANVRAHWEATR
jgi:hypothetical protein